jgi:hypothetical protein
VSILTLALGIGANTAIYSLVRSALLADASCSWRSSSRWRFSALVGAGLLVRSFARVTEVYPGLGIDDRSRCGCRCPWRGLRRQPARTRDQHPAGGSAPIGTRCCAW